MSLFLIILGALGGFPSLLSFSWSLPSSRWCMNCFGDCSTCCHAWLPFGTQSLGLTCAMRFTEVNGTQKSNLKCAKNSSKLLNWCTVTEITESRDRHCPVFFLPGGKVQLLCKAVFIFCRRPFTLPCQLRPRRSSGSLELTSLHGSQHIYLVELM